MRSWGFAPLLPLAMQPTPWSMVDIMCVFVGSPPITSRCSPILAGARRMCVMTLFLPGRVPPLRRAERGGELFSFTCLNVCPYHMLRSRIRSRVQASFNSKYHQRKHVAKGSSVQPLSRAISRAPGARNEALTVVLFYRHRNHS